MLKLITILLNTSLFATSIYNFNIPGADGSTINFSVFQGKKILIVNTATNSYFSSQYVALEQLYQQYKDSLVIIAVPGNSFNNEPDENAVIDSTVRAKYNIHFFLAGKMESAGEHPSALFQWLTKSAENGQMNSMIRGDFQKFLIDKNGNLIGYFSPAVEPFNPEIIEAIQGQ